MPTLTATDLGAVADADLVVLLTASADSLLGPEHLAPGAVVLDATQPRNTSPALLEQRPDVVVLDGGVVDIPSLRVVGGDIGLPDGRAYACFAETAMLALTGHHGHFAHRGAGPRPRRPHPRAGRRTGPPGVHPGRAHLLRPPGRRRRRARTAAGVAA